MLDVQKLNSHLVSGSVKSGSPVTFKSASGSTYVTAILLAMIDGMGSKVLAVQASSSSITVRDIVNDTVWNNPSAFAFSTSSSGVTITSDKPDASGFYMIRR